MNLSAGSRQTPSPVGRCEYSFFCSGPRCDLGFKKRRTQLSLCSARRLSRQNRTLRAATGKSGHTPSKDSELPIASSADEQRALQPQAKGETVALWVGAAVLFGLGVWALRGGDAAEQYFAGYLVEQSLSVDNLFVFILVFKYFKTPQAGQDKVLTYGILTAAVLRAIIVLLGVELIESFKPVLLGFAAILIYSSLKILFSGDDDNDEDLSQNNVVKLCRRFLTVSEQYEDEKFFTLENGMRVATPLLLVLAVIELSDIVFAVDSIPAVFGVTQDPFIVYTSNIFAILSLRALYGFVNTVLGELRFLGPAVALVLGFIGSKMIAEFCGFELSTALSLGVVATLLGGGVAASLLLPEPEKSQS